MAELYCIQCARKLEYTDEGKYVCPDCGYVSYFGNISSEMLELHAKAQWYQTDEQYFNALQMYEIILKNDESDYTALYGALLAEFGARYADLHDGSYELVCGKTQSYLIEDSDFYKKLVISAPAEAMEIYSSVLEAINKEQEKNNAKYLATAPIDEAKDYRSEALANEEGLADDYLSARERYLAKEREEREEVDRRRQEAKELEEAARRARENRAALAANKAKKKKITITAVASMVAVALCVILAVTLVIPAVHLGSARKAIADGKYDDAARSLRAADGFGESELLLSQYRFYGLESGDIVELGNYEQDGNESNGKETIEWIVLESSEKSVVLISKYVIDCVMYHENKDAPAYWESASLRKWLNGEFIEKAFASNEREMLTTTHNDNPDNDRCGTKGGDATDDMVYLLSIPETDKYLNENNSIGYPTAYAIERGVYSKTDVPGTFWWLRSPGSTQNSAAKVNGNGEIDIRGSGVNYSSYGVRPVITVTKAPIN